MVTLPGSTITGTSRLPPLASTILSMFSAEVLTFRYSTSYPLLA